MLDDGVNDAWYKSECGQACGFGGEKFKWLVRMVLLYPFVPRSASPLPLPLPLSLSLAHFFPSLPLVPFKIRIRKTYNDPADSFVPPPHEFRPQQDIELVLR